MGSYEGVPQGEGPKLTGVPFNDAYRYMDWLLTVPLLLIEILLVMKLEADDFNSRAWTLGFGSALMITSGYYGELVVTGDLTPRWVCWFASMSFFLYIVYELLVGLAAATAAEPNPEIAKKIGTAQVMTVISWCTYPIVFVPNARNFGGKSSGVHPTGLLCVRHYLEMQSWHCHLPDLLCQIQQAVSLAMSMFMIWRALAFASFSSRTDTCNFYR